ncbi:hypothetical protein [Mesorhizobium sp. 43Arga]
MGKKAKQKALESQIDSELEAEAAYYTRKVGITRDEALKIIKDAQPKIAVVHKGGAKAG